MYNTPSGTPTTDINVHRDSWNLLANIVKRALEKLDFTVKLLGYDPGISFEVDGRVWDLTTEEAKKLCNVFRK
jgi:hypothetical protein